MIAEINQKTYELCDTESPDSKIIIGGSNPDIFVPNINFCFDCFSGSEQYWMNVNRLDVRIKTQPHTFDKGEVRLESEPNAHDIFELDLDGNLKWNIEFLTKPATNVFDWNIKFHPSLKFYYQPELTQEEIDAGNERPEHIVGSYAVYCDKSGHFVTVDRTVVNYRNGKLTHIHRPLCIDSNKKTIWAELLIDPVTNLLRITIPQDFLDNASYPVTLDPTFGYNPAGTPGTASTIVNAQANDGNPVPYTAATGNTIIKYSAYVKTLTTGSGDMVAYTHDGSNPVTRTGNQASLPALDSTPAWRDTGAVTTVLANGVDYVIAIAETGNLTTYYDSGAAGDQSVHNAVTLDATWVRSSGSSNIMGIYATYEVAGGLSIPRPLSRPLSGPLGGI